MKIGCYELANRRKRSLNIEIENKKRVQSVLCRKFVSLFHMHSEISKCSAILQF